MYKSKKLKLEKCTEGEDSIDEEELSVKEEGSEGEEDEAMEELIELLKELSREVKSLNGYIRQVMPQSMPQVLSASGSNQLSDKEQVLVKGSETKWTPKGSVSDGGILSSRVPQGQQQDSSEL